MDKKRKADQKRELRAQKKQQKEDALCELDEKQPPLSTAEHSVLNVFREYLMTPGKMLCLGSSDLENFKKQLIQLIDKGMLVKEKFQGGYSLTENGFSAMKAGP